MAARGTNRMPNRLHHTSSRDSRRAWDGVSQPSALLSGGFEIELSGIKIGFTNPGPGIGDDLRLRYKPEAYCVSFEGPNSRGMLVPLEEMLLKDNLDGTISIFFRRQFRRKYYTLEGSSSRACDHIQAFKNELNLELHMLCFVAGYEPLTSAANFVRKVKQGRQNIPLLQRSSDFPAYTNYHHPQPHISIPVDPRDFHLPDDHFDELSQAQYRRNSYYAEPEMAERRHSTSGNSSGTEGGPRVHFRDHPPPPVPQPPPMQPRVPLRGGAGPSPGQLRDYGYEEQFVRDPRDARSMRNGSIDRGEEQFIRDPRNLRRSRTPVEERNGFESPPPRNSTPSPRDRYSRGQSATNGDRAGVFEQPLPPRIPTPASGDRDPRYPRSHSVVNGNRAGVFEPPLAPPTPAPQKRMFALVFKRSPIDQSFEIRPASIDSSHEALMRQAKNHWNLRELRLYGHVDGLKMNLNSQIDLEAYLKLCDGMQRLMVDVE